MFLIRSKIHDLKWYPTSYNEEKLTDQIDNCQQKVF